MRGERSIRLEWPGRLLDQWHLLSLDAPTVAAAWSCAFAWSAHVRVPWLSNAMLALATWLLYVADRLLDGQQTSKSAVLRQRHYFHVRHRVAFMSVALPGMLILGWFITRRMDPSARGEDVLLAACALLYLLCVHLPFPKYTRLIAFPKELAVGIIFAAACVIPAWSRQPSARPMLLAPGLLFGALCWVNCVAIDHWEQPLQERLLPKSQLGLGSTRWIGNHLRAACLALAIMSVCVAFDTGWSAWNAFCLMDLSIAVSVLLILWLHQIRRRLAPLRLRSAADAVLLIPIPVLAVAKAFIASVHWLGHVR
jgi:hypothetical protein